DRATSGGLARAPAVEQRCHASAHAVGHHGIANPDTLAVYQTLDSLARQRLELLDRRQLQIELAGGANHRPGQVMLGSLLDRRRQTKHVERVGAGAGESARRSFTFFGLLSAPVPAEF